MTNREDDEPVELCEVCRKELRSLRDYVETMDHVLLCNRCYAEWTGAIHVFEDRPDKENE